MTYPRAVAMLATSLAVAVSQSGSQTYTEYTGHCVWGPEAVAEMLATDGTCPSSADCAGPNNCENG